MNQRELRRHITKRLRAGYEINDMLNELQEKGVSKEQVDAVMNDPRDRAATARPLRIGINIVCMLVFLFIKNKYNLTQPDLIKLGLGTLGVMLLSSLLLLRWQKG
ncbi:MAG: hypothetical protein J7578_16830 [Chitinophagaceae bacterium]|nr:hypothetical protein [Chitinophagaceae bacterium]